ncbi:MAG: hypothetical protein H6752_20865 [Candidatus Omnitrophica bacterium]|nr:hypothetical protein [Candidatus Omnitrophota bacterium]
MSETLDLYLEKLIAKMNLDEEQRVEVEKEIRSHLEEAIQKRIEAGLPPEEAEKEALLQFGQPSVLARQFGVLSGTGWLVVERLTLAISLAAMVALFFLHFPFGPGQDAEVPWFIPIGFYCVLFCWPVIFSIWKYIEVNGVIRIHQPLKKSINIPFDSIESVEFQKGHLFGKKNLLVKWNGSSTHVDAGLRNFRCAALTLQALCPEAMETDVRDHLRRVGTARIAPESWPRNLAFTLVWLGTFSITTPFFSALWNFVGPTWWMPVLFAPPLLLIWLQGRYHLSRYKRVALWILAPLYFAIPVALFAGIFVADVTYVRWMIIGFFILAPTPLLVLWWKGPKGILIGSVFAFTAIAVVSINWVPYLWDGSFRALVATRFPIRATFQFGKQGENVAVISSPRYDIKEGFPTPSGSVLRLVYPESETKNFELEAAEEWTFLQPMQPGSITLAKWPSVREGESHYVEEVATLSKSSSSTIEFPEDEKLTVGGVFPLATLSQREVWSPSRNRILVYKVIPLEDDKVQHKIAVFDTSTGRLTTFEVHADSFPRWINDDHLEVLEFEYPEDERAGNPFLIHYWRLNATTGKEGIRNTQELPVGVSPSAYWNPECIEFVRETPPSYIVLPVSQSEGFDFSTLPERPVPNAEVGPHPNLSWVQTANRFSYFSDKHLVVGDLDGRTWTLPVDPENQCTDLALSPDGQTVAFAEMDSDLYFRVKVWRIEENSATTLAVNSMFGTGNFQVIQAMFSVDSILQWTPDSRSLLFPYGNQLLQADYEDWRDRRAG